MIEKICMLRQKNVEIMVGSDTSEIVKELFEPIT